MTLAFGKEPPVYAQPSNSHPPNYQPSSQPRPPPLPPHPQSPSSAAPEYRRQGSVIAAQHSGNSIVSSVHSTPAPLEATSTGGPPPLPPLPPQFHSNLVHPPQYVPSPPIPTTSVATRPLDIMGMATEQDYDLSSNGGTPNSVASPLEAGTPPRLPPNPEKAQALEALKTFMTDLTYRHEQVVINEIDDRLRHGSKALAWMENAVNTESAELERLIAASNENESILISKIAQARDLIDDVCQRPQPNIDDVVCAENVVYNQLYDLITDDHAIDDTIYVLSKALENDRINLDTFLKHTRTLAREQFMKRTLALKITTQVGLA